MGPISFCALGLVFVLQGSEEAVCTPSASMLPGDLVSKAAPRGLHPGLCSFGWAPEAAFITSLQVTVKPS